MIPAIDKEHDLYLLFEKLNLYDGNFLKRAAVLLFGKNPQKHYVQSHSKIGKFLSETDLQSSDIIEVNLIEQVDKIMDVLRLKYLKSYISYEGVHRREQLEYPYQAIREAVINALIHRDYTNTSNLQIKIYDDKLVIYNGATLSEEVPVDLFDKPHQSKPFNPVMAAVFYKCGFIESWGRGTLNIINESLSYGQPTPTFEYEWTAVKVTFYHSKIVISDQVSDQVSGRDKAILEYCILSRYAQEIMELIGIKHKTHFRQSILKPLIDKGYLELTIPEKPQSRLQKYKTTKILSNNLY